jgi:HD superfamily phosphodiesterase
MEYGKGKIVKLLVDHFQGDYRRITHALEVLKEAERIRDGGQQSDGDVVIAVALLHDVGIKPSEEQLGYNNGRTQEEFGPPLVTELLGRIDFPPEKIGLVARIVGNHHSPSRFTSAELEILKQADRIVNRREGGEALGPR